MKIMKIIFMIAITMAVTISLIMTNIGEKEEESHHLHLTTAAGGTSSTVLTMPSKRESRFLAQQRSLRAADHCRKDNQVCYTGSDGNSTCCNNKCVYLQTDKKNCGACKNKCKYTENCCRGTCVNLSFDKRHCGKCNNPCHGKYCFLGTCDYA